MNLFGFYGVQAPTNLRYNNWGGWSGDIVFGFHVLFQEDGFITASNYYVYGEPSASRPQGTGRAVWRGASTGHHRFLDEMGDESDTSWRGDVVLEIDDLNNPEIDITVNGLESYVPENTYPELVQATASAENIPLSMDGTFTSMGDSNEEWRGGFYGENHSHVGGVFSQGALKGAFGARRVD